MVRTVLLSILSLLCTSSFAVTVVVSPQSSRCGQANGAVVASALGGVPPYSFLWSNGATTPSIAGLVAGDYTVIVTDGLSNTDQATATVTDVFELGTPWVAEIRPDCDNSCTGWVSVNTAGIGGTPPYTIDFPFPAPMGPNEIWLMGLCGFVQQTITLTDAGGCPGSFIASVNNGSSSAPGVINSSPACGGQPNGSVTMDIGWMGQAWFQVIGNGINSIYDFAAPPFVITGLPAGAYSIWLYDPNLPGGGSAVYCTIAAQTTVGSLPGPCGSINGRVYHDADQDCVFNGADFDQPYRVISIAPGGAFAISDGNGQYQQNVGYGSYGVSQAVVPNETQICPANTPQPVTIDAANNNVTVDFANLSTVPHDLSVSLVSTNARPGFPTQVWIHVSNNSAFPSGSVTVDFIYDPVLTNTNPTVAQWTMPSILPYGHFNATAQGLVPANINLLGTVLNYTATVSNSASEINTANNTATISVTITGSYDPNDKQGTTNSGLGDAQYFLAQDEWIDYTVRFQNTGTATAETVVIRDEIDTDLNILSLEILGASHGFVPSFGDGRELVFTFDNIQLPDSTNDLLGSQGFISYRIKPNSDVVVGTMLENTAGIYFDFNPPIITNTTSHVVDFSTSVVEHAENSISLSPVPANDYLTVASAGAMGSIVILSVDGRVVLNMNLQANRAQIDLATLRSGAYLLIAEMKNGSIVRERFVKQ